MDTRFPYPNTTILLLLQASRNFLPLNQNQLKIYLLNKINIPRETSPYCMFQWIFCIRPSSGSKKLHLDVGNSTYVTEEKVNKSFSTRKWSGDPCIKMPMVREKLEPSIIIILLNQQRFFPLHHHEDARGYIP